VFLFDEPLSNLDARLRVETRTELARLHARLAATMVYVTHDQEEAMTLGGRVAVLRDGVLEQVAAPMEVYRRPATIFVAGFVGSPAINLLPADADASGAARLKAGGVVLPLPPSAAGGRSRVLTLGVRPHDLLLVPPGTGDLDAQIDVVEAHGNELVVHLCPGGDVAPAEIRVVAPPEQRVSAGASAGLRFDRERLLWFDGATGLRLD
jgi:ABC-type sugar transport system ATPase subunit